MMGQNGVSIKGFFCSRVLQAPIKIKNLLVEAELFFGIAI